MNPFLQTISILNLSSDSPGEWGFVYLLLKAMANSFNDPENNQFPNNAPRESLRRIALVEGFCPVAKQSKTAMNPGHSYQRIEQLLSPACIAYDSR